MGRLGFPIIFSYITLMEIKTEENNILIARRVPPGDRWRLLSNEPEGPINSTLTDTLEAYMVKTEFKGDYRLSPLKGKLFAIQTNEIEVKLEPIKQYSIYGEF